MQLKRTELSFVFETKIIAAPARISRYPVIERKAVSVACGFNVTVTTFRNKIEWRLVLNGADPEIRLEGRPLTCLVRRGEIRLREGQPFRIRQQFLAQESEDKGVRTCSRENAGPTEEKGSVARARLDSH